MKLFYAILRWPAQVAGICLVSLVLAGCGSLQYNDPINPKHPYMFPGQAPTTPGMVSAPAIPAAPASPAIPAHTIAAPSQPAPAVTSPPVAPVPVEAAPTPAPLVAPTPSPSSFTPAPVAPVTAPIPVTPVSPIAAVAPPASTVPMPAPANADALAATVFRPGDSLVVSFSDLPPSATLLPVNVELGEDGMIRLHHNVTVMALGKTARQLEQEIRAEYVPKYYRYLTVTIKTEMRFFHVNGEVKMPGQYPWRGETTVLRAIGQAQGFTDWAKKTKVQLTRANGENVTLNCEKAQKDPTKDLPVYPGDYINVPRKGIFGW